MKNKLKSTSEEPARSRSVLPSLTHLDAMQNVYSDFRGLNRKIQFADDLLVISHSLRGRTGGFSGWQTEHDVPDSLPNVHNTPLQSKRGQQRRRKRKEKIPIDTPSSRVVQTPTISIQVFDFAEDSPAKAKVKKTKIQRAGEQPKGRKGASIHPAKGDLIRNNMSSAGTQGSGMLGWT